MKITLSAFVCLFLLLFSTAFAQETMQDILYVGTFSERGSNGIYVLAFDRTTAELKQLQAISGKKSPSFLAIHPSGTALYAVYREGSTSEDQNGTVTAYAIDGATGKLTLINEQSSAGAGPCHISVSPDGASAFVSNYGGGNLAVYPVGKDGSLGPASQVLQYQGSSINEKRQEKPHVHSAIPSADGKFVYVSDLGTDKILIYQLDPNLGKLIAAKTPYVQTTAGAGPRHFALHPSAPYAYSLEELSSTVATYKIDKATGALLPVARENMLANNPPYEGENKAADIHLSPDGKFLYATTRGEDKVVTYAVQKNPGRLELTDHTSSGGTTPRNFCIDQRGAFLFVANQDSDQVVVFERNPATGAISPTTKEITIPAAVCIQQLRLPVE